MRIVIHDYPGHAFPVQLSRHLAQCGHEVWHVWSSDVESPRGPLSAQADDPESFHLCPITQGKALPKYNLIKRFFAERQYAKKFIAQISSYQADIVLSNPSPFIQGMIRGFCAKQGIAFVSWLQDIYYIPIRGVLVKKFGVIGRLAAFFIKHYELYVLKKSDHTIVISDAFKDFLLKQEIEEEKITTIPNWAILEEMDVLPKSNNWSKKQGLNKDFVYLYAGTLGLKHNPHALVDLAKQMPESKLVVITQGIGREYLEEAKVKENIENLILMDYQPFEDLPQVLATADVFVVLLEPEAGAFSVPSKILNYLCAGRPILGAIPLENAAAQNIIREEAGIVVAPEETEGFISSARKLYEDKALCKTMGKNGRNYAQGAFDIQKIGAIFESVFEQKASIKRKIE